MTRSGAPSGRGGRRPAPGAEVGAGAEALAGGGEDDGPDLERGRGLLQEIDDPVALVGGDGVADLGAVEGDPGHLVLDPVLHLVLEGRLVRHVRPPVARRSPVVCQRPRRLTPVSGHRLMSGPVIEAADVACGRLPRPR